MSSAAYSCWCCGTEHESRDPATDPWEGRMDGYCEPCSWARCDAYPGECPVKSNQPDPAAIQAGKGSTTPKEHEEHQRPARSYPPGSVGHWMWEGLRLFVEKHGR